jgi:hypothetical protein
VKRLGSVPVGLAIAAAVGLTARAAAAQDEPLPEDLPVAFGADEVGVDARSRAVDARGNVHVDAPPFHMLGSELSLRRGPVGVEIEGSGKVAFCPCLGTPLAVRFRHASLYPPHDLVLRDPVLELFGVPVAWLPIFWLRSPGKPGLLTPDVAWRGSDGFFAGGGVHVPLVPGDPTRGVDLRAGGYAEGGVAVQGTLRTESSVTTVGVDELRSDAGVSAAGHGVTSGGALGSRESAAWTIDAMRGARAVRATTDVDAAARPFDRFQAGVSWEPDGWLVSSGVRAAALRGGAVADLGAIGPVVAARKADALGHLGTAEATLEGGEVALVGQGATTFARAEGGTLLVAPLGPARATLALRGIGALADDGTHADGSGAAQARAVLATPLARGFESADAGDPWVHTTEPRLELAALVTRAGDVLPVGRGMVLPDGGAWVAGAGWSNALGRWGSRAAAEVDVVAGVIGDGQGAVPSLRGRLAAADGWWAVQADAARVQMSGYPGGALSARGRFGPVSGLHLSVHAEERDGVDPVVARALFDAPLEPASGFLAAAGWTGGAGVGLPVGPRVTVRAAADGDAETRQLIAAVGSIELHDPCGCVVVRATVAHRIDRDGVDAWLSVDLPLAER